MAEPENFVIRLLQELRAEIRELRENMASKSDLAELRAEVRSELRSLRADVSSDLLLAEQRTNEQFKRVGEQVAGLRRAVVEYHSSAVGHGLLLGELEERVRRLETAPT